MVPVEDCIATTGAVNGKGCGWMGGGGIGDGVWGAVKEGEGFGEEVGGVGKEDKTEELLAGSLLEPVETHADRLGLLRPNRRSRKTDGAFVVDKYERG